MPKLAIYVPKKDMKEIDRWRKKINFSRVFMRALQHEIRDHQRTLESTDDQLSTAARHYRRKLTEGADTLLDLGYRLGSRHMLDCHLEPETIRRLLTLEDRETLSTEDRELIEAILDSQLQTLVQDAHQLGFNDQAHPEFLTDAFRGYIKGVAAAWAQVCAEMKEL